MRARFRGAALRIAELARLLRRSTAARKTFVAVGFQPSRPTDPERGRAYRRLRPSLAPGIWSRCLEALLLWQLAPNGNHASDERAPGIRTRARGSWRLQTEKKADKTRTKVLLQSDYHELLF